MSKLSKKLAAIRRTERLKTCQKIMARPCNKHPHPQHKTGLHHATGKDFSEDGSTTDAVRGRMTCAL